MNTFYRALLAFVVLTVSLLAISFCALAALTHYAGGYVWANLLVIIMTFIFQIAIYTSTVHEPIFEWIRKPAKDIERKEELEHMEKKYKMQREHEEKKKGGK